jgi:flagellar biosynthesis protein FlhB
MPQLIQITGLYPEQQSIEVLHMMFRYALVCAAVFLLAGSFDVYQQRKRFKDQVFMDYEEMKREHREQEGDPHLKAHRRALHQSLSRQQMIEQIKRSKVIIVERR